MYVQLNFSTTTSIVLEGSPVVSATMHRRSMVWLVSPWERECDHFSCIITLIPICLSSIVQSSSTVVSGLVLGFVFVWKLGLVAMGAYSLVHWASTVLNAVSSSLYATHRLYRLYSPSKLSHCSTPGCTAYHHPPASCCLERPKQQKGTRRVCPSCL